MTETPQPPALPADEPQAVDEYGVTGEEQRLGESMAGRLEREEPDIGACDPSEGRVGRLVEPDEGARTDDEKDVIARDAGAAGGGLAAEEATMREVTEDDALP